MRSEACANHSMNMEVRGYLVGAGFLLLSFMAKDGTQVFSPGRIIFICWVISLHLPFSSSTHLFICLFEAGSHFVAQISFTLITSEEWLLILSSLPSTYLTISMIYCWGLNSTSLGLAGTLPTKRCLQLSLTTCAIQEAKWVQLADEPDMRTWCVVRD